MVKRLSKMKNTSSPIHCPSPSAVKLSRTAVVCVVQSRDLGLCFHGGRSAEEMHSLWCDALLKRRTSFSRWQEIDFVLRTVIVSWREVSRRRQLACRADDQFWQENASDVSDNGTRFKEGIRYKKYCRTSHRERVLVHAQSFASACM